MSSILSPSLTILASLTILSLPAFSTFTRSYQHLKSYLLACAYYLESPQVLCLFVVVRVIYPASGRVRGTKQMLKSCGQMNKCMCNIFPYTCIASPVELLFFFHSMPRLMCHHSFKCQRVILSAPSSLSQPTT